MVHNLIPQTVTMLHYMAKRIKVADVIEVAIQLTLRWKDYPGLSTLAQCNHKGSYSWKRDVEERENQVDCSMRRSWPNTDDFEDGERRPRTKEHGWSLEAEKG